MVGWWRYIYCTVTDIKEKRWFHMFISHVLFSMTCLCACVSPPACIWMCSHSSICRICKRSSLIALLMQPVVVACHRDLALSCPKLDCLTSPLPKYIQTLASAHFSRKVLLTAGARINFLCRTENLLHRYTLSFPAFLFLIFHSTWRPMNSR